MGRCTDSFVHFFEAYSIMTLKHQLCWCFKHRLWQITSTDEAGWDRVKITWKAIYTLSITAHKMCWKSPLLKYYSILGLVGKLPSPLVTAQGRAQRSCFAVMTHVGSIKEVLRFEHRFYLYNTLHCNVS